MIKKRKVILKAKLLFAGALCTVGLVFFISPNLKAINSNSESLVFSITVENKALELVLQNISKSTGYKITVNEQWKDIPVTANFKDVNLEKGLRRLLKGFNHALATMEDEKKISITIYGLSSEKKPITASSEVIPPIHPGEKGITQAAVEAKRMRQENTDPLDQEVIPPTVPGRPGVTLREMEELRKTMEKIIEQKKISGRGDWIPVPPDKMLKGVNPQPDSASK
jgi:hypothetical protein